MGSRVPIDMARVRELHAQGWTCKAIADHLGVEYGTLRWRTRRDGLSFPLKGARHIMPTVCKRGHDLTDPEVRDDRGCGVCRRLRDRVWHQRNAKRAARQRALEAARAKPKNNLMQEAREERDATRVLLNLHERWERESRADLKLQLRREYEALRGGDARMRA